MDVRRGDVGELSTLFPRFAYCLAGADRTDRFGYEFYMCRGRAAADLLASVAMPMGNARLRMEASAASWTARADLLQRDEDDFEAQRKSGFDA